MIQIGIDEVGRGSWAGPIVFAAVGFPSSVDRKDFKKIVIRDSKLMTADQRKRAEAVIRENAIIHVEYLSCEDIDLLGLSRGLARTIQRLVKKVLRDLPIGESSKFWIDGRRMCTLGVEHEYIIKGDRIMPIISAASIVAKVERDAYMTELGQRYQEYGFDLHKGYGTARHVKALAEYGISPVHRRSYRPIKAFL